MPSDDDKRFCYLDFSKLIKVEKIQFEIRPTFMSGEKTNQNHYLIEEMPMRLPSEKNFKLDELKINCNLFDIDVQNILPKDGKFY